MQGTPLGYYPISMPNPIFQIWHNLFFRIGENFHYPAMKHSPSRYLPLLAILRDQHTPYQNTLPSYLVQNPHHIVWRTSLLYCLEPSIVGPSLLCSKLCPVSVHSLQCHNAKLRHLSPLDRNEKIRKKFQISITELCGLSL